MITKILFTVAVVGLVLMLMRMGQRRPQAAPGKERRGSIRPLMRFLALAVIVLMLVAASLVIYLEWRSAHEVLSVRVIDVRSGKQSTYQVYRGKLGERSFQAVDGRQIMLAETDRLEIAPDPASPGD